MYNNHPTSPQRGFTLLEVLITIVVIAGALLGTAGMQAYGLKITQGSQFRTQAVFLASNLLERIEANNDGAKSGSYVATVGGGGRNAPNCAATACVASDLAAFDLSQFEDKLLDELPAVSAAITRADLSPAGPWIYTVTITWQETKYRPKGTTSASGGNTETVSYSISRTVYDRSTVL